jgi:alkylation response protein AidB-like acyl-CoA dehydrogenase
MSVSVASEPGREKVIPVASEILDKVRRIASANLPGLTLKIDREGYYPETVLREFGDAGAFRGPLAGADGPGSHDLKTAIEAMQIAGEYCLSTSFCVWCQDTFTWYLANTANTELRDRLAPGAAAGSTLGGTGLSNAMKCFAGIEKVKLSGRRTDGGYRVTGVLPWVSNLGEGHYFGTVFEDADRPGCCVMAGIDCSQEGVTLAPSVPFTALDGTRTFAVQARNAFIPDAMVLADPAEAFVDRIRAGFVLLQAGMAFGIIQSCITLMKRMHEPLGHVNKYLEEQPEYFEEELAALRADVFELAAAPHNTCKDYWRAVLGGRLKAGELTVQAAHAAMLHCGARGYVINGEAQRRLREAYFVAIVTPATKQLRKMLAETPACGC